MNINSISTQLLYTTFPIWSEKKDGKISTGTAFIFNMEIEGKKDVFIPLLITNYHVIKDSTKVYTEFVKGIDNNPDTGNKIRVELDSKIFYQYSDELNDLAAHPIAPIINSLSTANYKVFYRSIDKSIIPNADVVKKLSAIEEVLFIGYPSGLYDTRNSFPIVRKGITATPIWNNFENEEKFLIDAGVYPGSSGSPVFIYNQGSFGTDEGITIGSRLLFIGIISETIITTKNDTQNYFLGLGRVVNSKCLVNFITNITKGIMNIRHTT